MTVEPARDTDHRDIRALLTESGLPLSGLGEVTSAFLVARVGDRLVGCAVVESYGRLALLRSVAVAGGARESGVGTALVTRALAGASESGLSDVFLLTETAAPFFARLGFQPVSRTLVPDEIRASEEFARVCPVSALTMARPAVSVPPGSGPVVRAAEASDADAIARIYNQGIEDRVATFETRLRTADDIRRWFDGRHPTSVVVVRDEPGAPVVAFATSSGYRARECYEGVAESSVYVDRSCRGAGFGRLAVEAIIAAATRAGFWKLVSRVFVENAASRHLIASAGFREVGVYERHARLDGRWRDVVIVERLLPAARV